MNEYSERPDVLKQRIAELERRISSQDVLIERTIKMMDSTQQTIGNLIDIVNKIIFSHE